MADVFSKTKRSEVMSLIRSRGNKDTELALMAFFRRHKITGWRRHLEIRSVPRPAAQKMVFSPTTLIRRRTSASQSGTFSRSHGRRTMRGNRQFRVRPDFVFPKSKLAVFVDGCFWHGCPKHGTKPKGNAAFWRKKITGNQVRDRLVTRTLRKSGWRVLRIWEHALRRANMPPGSKRKEHSSRRALHLRRANMPQVINKTATHEARLLWRIQRFPT